MDVQAAFDEFQRKLSADTQRSMLLHGEVVIVDGSVIDPSRVTIPGDTMLADDTVLED